jgi:hypothetical protein
MQWVPCFFHRWKYRWNWHFGIECRMVSEWSWISEASWKWHPFGCEFIVRNRNKSQGATGPKVHRFRPSRGQWIFDIKNLQQAFLLRRIKALCPMVRFYSMLKVPSEYDRNTFSKFKDVSCQLPALLLDVSAETRELWWIYQEWLELRWGCTVDQKMAAVHGHFVWYHPVAVTTNQ